MDHMDEIQRLMCLFQFSEAAKLCKELESDSKSTPRFQSVAKLHLSKIEAVGLNLLKQAMLKSAEELNKKVGYLHGSEFLSTSAQISVWAHLPLNSPRSRERIDDFIKLAEKHENADAHFAILTSRTDGEKLSRRESEKYSSVTYVDLDASKEAR